MKKLIFILVFIVNSSVAMQDDQQIMKIAHFYQKYIQPYIFLRQSCKPLYQFLTLKKIAALSCPQLEKKDILLMMVVEKFYVDNYRLNLPVLATILVYAGANPNLSFMKESLLHKALIKKANFLVKALFEHNVQYDDIHFLIGPIFF